MHSAETLSQSSEPRCVEMWLLGIKPLKTSATESSKKSQAAVRWSAGSRQQTCPWLPVGPRRMWSPLSLACG